MHLITTSGLKASLYDPLEALALEGTALSVPSWTRQRASLQKSFNDSTLHAARA
jgi:hypothetical protein